jgi:hypothetical protein
MLTEITSNVYMLIVLEGKSLHPPTQPQPDADK